MHSSWNVAYKQEPSAAAAQTNHRAETKDQQFQLASGSPVYAKEFFSAEQVIVLFGFPTCFCVMIGQIDMMF